ncbi:hypothetical protein HYFRA_00003035 [Hymenoscyphus fraxineus]|uniref:F-box domain-containing protein n=1 Tax=Hymenoscyphus fraxineus TaxID=746836 RepID=A0A9N9KN46_9HELO|nr:hypothetical protein HYFRA_00003035 [Hymenoscyphus fraxineus]
MSKNTFIEMPLEIKNRIFEQLLLFELPIDMVMRCGKPIGYSSNATMSSELSFPVLSLNKQINLEASTFLYQRNEFKFATDCNTYTITPFLRNIGEQNAGFIHRICISYPTMECNEYSGLDESYGIALPICGGFIGSRKVDDMSAQAFRVIAWSCPNLKFLTMTRSSTRESRHNGSSRLDIKAVLAVNEHLKNFPKETKIVVDVQLGPEDSQVERTMRSCGWMIKS